MELTSRIVESNLPITNKELYEIISNRITNDEWEENEFFSLPEYTVCKEPRSCRYFVCYDGGEIVIDFIEEEGHNPEVIGPIILTGTRERNIDRILSRLSRLLKMKLVEKYSLWRVE